MQWVSEPCELLGFSELCWPSLSCVGHPRTPASYDPSILGTAWGQHPAGGENPFPQVSACCSGLRGLRGTEMGSQQEGMGDLVTPSDLQDSQGPPAPHAPPHHVSSSLTLPQMLRHTPLCPLRVHGGWDQAPTGADSAPAPACPGSPLLAVARHPPGPGPSQASTGSQQGWVLRVARCIFSGVDSTRPRGLQTTG